MKKNFYLPIINALKQDTNLSRIQRELGISKQQLNYYLRELKKTGHIYKKSKGWYELTDSSKNMTNHTFFLDKDISRGHAYVWDINFGLEIEGSVKWKNRIEILRKNNINLVLVGALKDIPRIKVLGRKVWLCKNHIKVYDTPNSSYYGLSAKESRYSALNEIKSIVGALNRKLGLSLKPEDIYFRKEHYALIKNDLAIEENRKGNIIRISNEDEEWLLIDDSLGQGGELENVGKSAYKTNIPMQKWWNEQKETKFEVTPKFILETFNQVAQTQILDKANIQLHQKVLDDMLLTLKQIRESLDKK